MLINIVEKLTDQRRKEEEAKMVLEDVPIIMKSC